MGEKKIFFHSKTKKLNNLQPTEKAKKQKSANWQKSGIPDTLKDILPPDSKRDDNMLILSLSNTPGTVEINFFMLVIAFFKLFKQTKKKKGNVLTFTLDIGMPLIQTKEN